MILSTEMMKLKGPCATPCVKHEVQLSSITKFSQKALISWVTFEGALVGSMLDGPYGGAKKTVVTHQVFKSCNEFLAFSHKLTNTSLILTQPVS